MEGLSGKILIAQLVIRSIIKKFKNNEVGFMWSGGKDSTALLHIIKNMFNNNFPFLIFFIDTRMEFKETYAFVKSVAKDWKLKVQFYPVSRKPYINFKNIKYANKISARIHLSNIIRETVKNIIFQHQLKCLIYGGRSDEKISLTHKFFLKRRGVTLAFPLKCLTEQDVWNYTHRYKLPYIKIYDRVFKHIETVPFTIKSSI